MKHFLSGLLLLVVGVFILNTQPNNNELYKNINIENINSNIIKNLNPISNASAQQPGMFQPLLLSGSAGPVTCTYINNYTQTTSASPSFSVSIGSAAADRVVIVMGFGRDTGTGHSLTGATIGGNAMTALTGIGSITNYLSGSDGIVAGAYGLLVPSGTTSTVVLNFSASMFNSQVQIYTVTGNGGVVTPKDTKSDATINSGTPTATLGLSTNASGCAIGYIAQVSTATSTWTGLTTKDYQLAMPTTSAGISGAHINLTTGSTLNVSVAGSGNFLDPILLAASW